MIMREPSSRSSKLVGGAAVGALLVVLAIQQATARSPRDMDGGETMHQRAPPQEFSFGKPGKATTVNRTVNITMGDMNFDPISLEVTAGETVRFVIANKSEIDHDFTIGDAETQSAHRAEMAEAMQKGEMRHNADPNAVLVTAGQKRELIWQFTQAGSLEFDCNIPGHYEAGMKGIITVHPKGGGGAKTCSTGAPTLTGEHMESTHPTGR